MNRPAPPMPFQQVAQALRQASRVVMVAHPKPDGDTLGAALALSSALQCSQPKTKVAIYCQDLPPVSLRFLPLANRVSQQPEILKQEGVLICVFDAGDLRYAGLEAALTPEEIQQHTIIDIDHHTSNTYFGDLNLVDLSASSTCEVVYFLLKEMNLPIAKATATCLLTGLITDTGAFTNLATTPGSLHVAGELLRRGASVAKIARLTIQRQNISRLRLWGLALSRLHRHPETKVVTTSLTIQDFKECGTDSDEMEGIANFLNGLDDAVMVIVYHERSDGKIKGSMRTTHPLMDVAKIAKLMGGGGHAKAAGFVVEDVLIFSAQEGWQLQRHPLPKPSAVASMIN